MRLHVNLKGRRKRLFDRLRIVSPVRRRTGSSKNTCPSCNSKNVELVHGIEDRGGYGRKEQFLCYECGCEWDWAYKRPFFRWPLKVRAPKWLKID